MKPQGMTVKQIDIRSFMSACDALQRAYNEGNAASIIQHSLEVHRLKGCVPVQYNRMIPK
jgi:hypothetical protein